MSHSPGCGVSRVREEQWNTEARFFDERSAKTKATRIDPLSVARYRPPHRLRFNKEFRFHVLGDLKDKRVLDVGCGDGANAVLLATLGAKVTGIDLSRKSIELAEERVRVNSLESRVEFICSPLETASIPAASFDIIWGDGILHHVIEDLDTLAGRLMEWLKPGGIVMFAEPVNFNQTLRRIRFMIPVSTEATPDERPLEPAEVNILRKHLPALHVRMFTLLGRLDRFIIRDYNYERSSAWRRGVSNAIALLDALLLRMPGVRRLGGTAVIYGRTPAS